VLPYLSYSSDLALTNYHLFRSLTDDLGEKRNDEENDFKMDLGNSFRQKSQEFYERGVLSLPERWRQVTDSARAYIIKP
jgi:histone-lysine N-methyltransferase SETMAR